MPCVVVSGGDVHIEDCIVKGGMKLEGNARGEVRRNKITGGNMPALIVIDEASPHIVGNEVTGGGEAGVYIAGNSYPLMEDNHIFGNGEAGVLVSGASLPVVCNNRLPPVITQTPPPFLSHASPQIDLNVTTNNAFCRC